MAQNWNVLDDDEAAHNKAAIEQDFNMKGVMTHPVTFRPYAFFEHKYEKGQIILFPLERADIIEQ